MVSLVVAIAINNSSTTVTICSSIATNTLFDDVFFPSITQNTHKIYTNTSQYYTISYICTSEIIFKQIIKEQGGREEQVVGFVRIASQMEEPALVWIL